MSFTSLIILVQFRGQFDDAENRSKALAGQLTIANQEVLDLRNISLRAKHFIDADCRFQYIRTTNTFTRLNRAIAIDHALLDSDARLADYADIASKHWTEQRDPTTTTYWSGIALEDRARATARQQQIDLDVAALAALKKGPTLDSSCQQPKQTSKTFISPTATPGARRK
jgi:hypothetical protein